MPGGVRGSSVRRYRIMIWLDEALGPVQWAAATYVGDEAQTETTGACGPFDTLAQAVVQASSVLHQQLPLF